MKALFAASALFLAAASPVLAQTQVPVARHADYADARAVLLKDGWRPVPQKGSAGDRCFGRSDVCDAYPEAMSCSGTGAAFCYFVFAKEGHMLGVVTSGENVADLYVWSRELDPCADDDTACQARADADRCDTLTSTAKAPGERVLTFTEDADAPMTLVERGRVTRFGIMSGAYAVDMDKQDAEWLELAPEDGGWYVGDEKFVPYCER